MVCYCNPISMQLHREAGNFQEAPAQTDLLPGRRQSDLLTRLTMLRKTSIEMKLHVRPDLLAKVQR